MDEKQYREQVRVTFRRVLDAFDQVDVDQADVDEAGDVITIKFANGGTLVMNTQAAVQQVWLAGEGRGWHFDYNVASGIWEHDKGSGDELLSTVAGITERAIGEKLEF